MMLISQDGLKAIDTEKIDFYAILPDRSSNGKFRLFAKTPAVSNNYYDYLILFEHENIEVVKHVMRFLAINVTFLPVARKNEALFVELPDLYRHGMKEIEEAEIS